jgi:restriction endonuclease S subunit
MAVTSVVKISELEGAKRIDAEYYRTDILNLKEIVQKSPLKVVRLGNLVKKGYRVVYWSTNVIPRQEMKKEDVFFLQATNVDSAFPFIRAEDMGGVWHKDWEDYPEGRIAPKELLIEVKGKAEKVALVPEDFPLNTLVSGSLYKLSVKQGIEPEYVLVYALTKFGKGFRDRLKTNLLVAFVNKKDLYSIPIVVLSSRYRKKIKELYSDAYEALKKSENLYTQAKNLLLKTLRLSNFKPKYELSYATNLSNAFEFHRVDAEYFQPIYHALIKHLSKNFELMPLGKLLLEYRRGMEVGSENYEEEGKPFIRVSNLSINGFVERDQKYISEELYQQLKDEYEPRVGDFLLTKDATLGIAYVLKEPAEGVIAGGILRLTINENDVNKEYLATCVNSIIGKMQIERDGGGSVITHWRPEQIKRLQIPILPHETQQKIASLVQQSHKARRKAKELLEKAKKEVETVIEKSAKI